MSERRRHSTHQWSPQVGVFWRTFWRDIAPTLQDTWETIAPITVRNLLAPTTVVFWVLSIVLFFTKQGGDALFLISTISLNTVIGIFQECRAIFSLKKLELMNAVTARKVTNIGLKEMSLDQLIAGDLIRLELGDQIPVDGTVHASFGCQVDESLLTGESIPVDKEKGDPVFAGSFVVTGAAEVKIVALGNHTRVAQMTEKLRWYDRRLTPLQRDFYNLIRWLTIAAVVVSILIFIRHHGGTIPLTDTMNTIVSGALSLIPEGLLLASTILLSYGAVKLASQGVLIQHLPAIEGFSRLRYLCLDKTGTLTQSATVLQSIEPFSGYRLGVIYEYLQGFAYGDPAPNSTIRAIAAALPSAEQHVVDRVPFSSDKKWSAICLKEGNRYRWLSLGAPEHLAAHCQNEVAILRNAQEKMALGIRVLLLVDYGLQSETAFPHQEKGQPSAFLLFSQQLRPNVIDALFYVQAQGVSVKVISGDSVSTVKAIAKKVGIRQSDVCITGEELAMLDELTWYEKVPQYTIFARIVPEQKEKIIRTLTKYGFTGMVGDGVNDALALKNANLSVAMAEGSPASRKVADVVLLTNNFSVFPAGMRLGNQIILSLEMITCLFIHRIVFSSVLLLLALILGSSYPFQSRHLLLLNVFVVGIPTFLWSVFPQETGHRAENKGFFQRILRYALPQGLITGLAITVGYALATLLYSSGNDTTTPRLVATMIAFALSMLTFWTIPLSLNAIQSRSLQILQGWYFTVSPLLFFALFQFEWVRNYFGFTTISIPQWITIIVVVIAAGYGQILLVRRERKRVY